jgi:acetolactate synthase-1/2/3 large subunit
MSESKAVEERQGLHGLVPEGYQLLVSCFDADHTVGGGLFAIGDAVDVVDRVSTTGLSTADGLLFRCLWSAEGSPAELVAYDETGVRRYHRLDSVSDPHDILVMGQNVLVVATTQNEVQCVAPDGEILWRWRAPGEPDSWHLNSLARRDDKIVVCGFGPFTRHRGWDESGKPASGRVVGLDTGEPVLTGLRAPHSPWYDDGTWLVCDSAAGQLLEIREATGEVSQRLDLPGWPRGLVVTDDHLFVGISPDRHAAGSVETAAVAIVNRSDWSLTGLVALPGREVYALALAPTALVDGARKGFDTNHTRAHEQGQRRLFDRLGVQPKQLWATGDRLEKEERKVTITVESPVAGEVEANSLLSLDCQVRNGGLGILTPAPPYPVRVVQRWYDMNGDIAPTKPIKTPLTRSLPPEAAIRLPVRSRVPSTPGKYRLRVTLDQDGIPFDQFDESSAVDVSVNVVAAGLPCDVLTSFGLYPAEERAARVTGGTVEDVVQALVTHPSGEPNGLTFGLIEHFGQEAFLSAVAVALGCSASSIEFIVGEAIRDSGNILLTGAEVVALALVRSGVRVAFGYAGTSELALCDAFARLKLLRNGRGDKEALFMAGGASRLRPGAGAALLHAARGLTNALGALADLRRNEAGTVVVVGLPSTGSAPFLPPHGEPDLIATCGAFAKSWCEFGPVPEDPRERRTAVDYFITSIREAVDDALRPPYGPVLVGVPQDVAEKAWVPLSALAGLDEPRPAAADTARELRSATALLATAQRSAVLIDDYALTHPGIRPALASFCERTGSPVFQVKYRRGAMLFERLSDIDVPGFLGWYDPADPAHRGVLGAADVVITIEDRNMYPRVVGDLPPCRKIALTSKPSAADKNGYLQPGDVMINADVVASLHALASAAEDRSAAAPWYPEMEPSGLDAERRNGAPVPESAATIRSGIASAIGDLSVRLRENVILVDDSQMFGGLLAEEYRLLPAGLRIFGGHGGFVGGGIACATGLALGEPSVKVICSLGDQGFTNGIQGLVAAVQESAPVTFLLCNNGGSVSLRKQSRSQGLLDDGRNVYLDNAAGMCYQEVVGALGVRAQRVDLSDCIDRERIMMRLEAFRQSLDTAVGHPGPTLIELVLPADPAFWTGVWSTAGFEQVSQPAPVAVGAGNA